MRRIRTVVNGSTVAAKPLLQQDFTEGAIKNLPQRETTR
jgi:hypothetical protein